MLCFCSHLTKRLKSLPYLFLVTLISYGLCSKQLSYWHALPVWTNYDGENNWVGDTWKRCWSYTSTPRCWFIGPSVHTLVCHSWTAPFFALCLLSVALTITILLRLHLVEQSFLEDLFIICWTLWYILGLKRWIRQSQTRLCLGSINSKVMSETVQHLPWKQSICEHTWAHSKIHTENIT